MAWVGSTLVTVGTRHVKVWRLNATKEAESPSGSEVETPKGLKSPSNRTLSGRNCILGPLLETTLTCIVAVGPAKAVVCSEKGDICLLNDTDGNQKFEKVAELDFPITASAINDGGKLLLASQNGLTFELGLDDISRPVTPPKSKNILAIPCEPHNCIVALSPFLGHIVTVEKQGGIKLRRVDAEAKSEKSDSTLAVLPSHGGAVQGVRPFCGSSDPNVLFMTWSAQGSILFWGENGTYQGQRRVDLEQLEYDSGVNELRVVRTVPSVNALVTGDRYGVLQYV